MLATALGQARKSKAAVVVAKLRRLLDDGRICVTNNPAERVLRGIALGQIIAARGLGPRR